jgi:hypothetical protein
LLSSGKITEAFDSAKRIMAKPISAEEKFAARMIQAQVLESEFNKHLEALRLNIRESLHGSLNSRSGRVKGWIRAKLNYSERLSIYIGIETLEYHVFKKTITVK